MQYIESFKAARRAAVPLVVVNATDYAAVMQDLSRVTFRKEPAPLLRWDVCSGVVAMNPAAREMEQSINEGQSPAMITGNPVEALLRVASLTVPGTIVFMLNAHMFLTGSGDSHKPVIQAVWNLRDQFKTDNRTLVMLCPSMKIPQELANDVIELDVPLPGDGDLRTIVTQTFAAAKLTEPDEPTLVTAVDSLSGLNAFSAEQVVSMSLRPDGLDMQGMWERKRKVIEQTEGLKVFRGSESFADIGGLDNLKGFMSRIIGGRQKPRLFVFLDEIEKAMPNSAAGDTSGTSQDQLKVLLTSMQDEDWTGVILLGFPGTGKSAFAKACGNEAGCPVVEADLGAMKGSLVGESEARMRAFIKTVKAMGQKEVFFLATCNSIATLKPELKRRFRKGIFFSDLPDAGERKVIWQMYRVKYGINESDATPKDDGWTGAEIKVCCENAAEFGCTLKEASKFVTIASKAMGDAVNTLRREASGKYINASAPGVYTFRGTSTDTLRSIELN